MKILEGIPDVLFKYRSFKNENNLRTLFNFELFLSSTSLFNDPYEGAIPFIYDEADLTPDNIFLKLQEMARKKYPTWPENKIHKHCFDAQQRDLFHDENHIKRVCEDTNDFIRKNFGVLSLTSDPFNYLMWSHYANGHNGFCIGFDKHLLHKTVGGGLGHVIYDTNIPRHKLFGDISEFYLKLLMTKSNVWEYENEYRLTKMHAANKVVKYPKEMIQKIYLGFKSSFNNRLQIIDFIKENKLDCEVFQLTLNNEYFKFNSDRIY
ncbi:MAG: hypothetical protein CVU11_14565 [Bacteroidetes bacterium HGW-Bacteroidetes-6]|jgi:hypothetical protein|nr:MAG: hypothetical protein CVU11_14565 [Bacteroidetes bacterium HGW-Bacteroidetes-6]